MTTISAMDAIGAEPPLASPILESIESRPWSSLTFAGERHRLVVRVPAAPLAIDGRDLDIPGVIVAVERSAATVGRSGTVVSLDLLTIDASPTAGPGARP